MLALSDLIKLGDFSINDEGEVIWKDKRCVAQRKFFELMMSTFLEKSLNNMIEHYGLSKTQLIQSLFIMRVTDLFTWKKYGYANSNSKKKKREIQANDIEEITCHKHGIYWDNQIIKRGMDNARFDAQPYDLLPIVTKLNAWRKGYPTDQRFKRYPEKILNDPLKKEFKDYVSYTEFNDTHAKKFE